MTAPNSNTPNGIIYDAMKDSGLLQRGQEPSSEDYAEYSRKLLDIINVEQTAGLKLWLNVDTPLTLVADQATYVLGPGGDVNMVKPLRVIEAYYLLTEGLIRRPLNVLAWSDYIMLGSVGQSGQVNSYFVNKKQTELEVFFWLTPDATCASEGVAHLLLQVQVENFTNLTDTMNFPAEWRMFLHWALANEICTGQPEAIMNRCAQKYIQYKDMLEAWDVEDAPTQFTPDSRVQNYGGNFR